MKTFMADLELKSYVRRCRHLLTARSNAIRVEKCPKLLNHLKNKGEDARIFVEEKLTVHQFANCQDVRAFARDPIEIPPVM